VISGAQLQRKKKYDRALISIAQLPSGAPKSKLEQCLAAPNCQKASSSSDFERPNGYGARLSSDFARIMRKHCAFAVFSNAVGTVWKQSTSNSS